MSYKGILWGLLLSMPLWGLSAFGAVQTMRLRSAERYTPNLTAANQAVIDKATHDVGADSPSIRSVDTGRLIEFSTVLHEKQEDGTSKPPEAVRYIAVFRSDGGLADMVRVP